MEISWASLLHLYLVLPENKTQLIAAKRQRIHTESWLVIKRVKAKNIKENKFQKYWFYSYAFISLICAFVFYSLCHLIFSWYLLLLCQLSFKVVYVMFPNEFWLILDSNSNCYLPNLIGVAILSKLQLFKFFFFLFLLIFLSALIHKREFQISSQNGVNRISIIYSDW